MECGGVFSHKVVKERRENYESDNDNGDHHNYESGELHERLRRSSVSHRAALLRPLVEAARPVAVRAHATLCPEMITLSEQGALTHGPLSQRVAERGPKESVVAGRSGKWTRLAQAHGHGCDGKATSCPGVVAGKWRQSGHGPRRNVCKADERPDADCSGRAKVESEGPLGLRLR